MLLGKRPRPPIKRTTSMKEFTLDLNINDPSVAVINYQPFDPLNPYNFTSPVPPASNGQDQRLILTRRRSADFVETAHFLRACSLCKRQLIPGRDIYMYRGDSAFCSLDCREKQMKQDERKEKFPKVPITRKKVTNSAAMTAVASGTGSDAPPQARP